MLADAPSAGIPLPDRLTYADVGPARWPTRDWWRGFGSPELDGLMEAAAGNNFDIAVAIAQVRQADAQARITGAALLPTVNLTGSATRSQSASSGGSSTSTTGAGTTTGVGGVGTTTGTTTSTVISGGGGGNRQSSIFRASLAASYEIDFWGKNTAALAAAERTRAANQFNVGAVMLTTQATVANTYFELIAAQARLAIAESNLRDATRILEVIRLRVSVGTATGLDLAQQETTVAQLRANVPPLRQTVEQDGNTLATLIGRTPESLTVRGGGFERIVVPPVNAGLPAELIVRRPDVWQAEAQLASAQASVANARAQMLPSVQLTATGGVQSLLLGTLLRPESQLFTLAAALTQPLIDGGKLRAQVDLARAQVEQYLASYRYAIVNALTDSENALVALRRTTEQEELQAQAVRQAERAFAIAEAQLRAGTIDLVSLLTAQQSLYTARNTLAQVRLLRLQAAVGLFRALGGGWS
ncbi:efflux transporter outer membrane subunit [Roseomonas sp. NAR14]|uniref:Efflux transporter outer membrane subunit n=1 Tax=Roseomonas acroporae TaxID=2937791 RepID=A0A9X1Y4Z1_9PROT|nr:efflux transporter outer membrane subunit [Roseomonas acroporae]MCK8783591.1 efflux transporter outer membrane subunit [Roseomonas acroporae]